MKFEILNKVPDQFKKYELNRIESGASKKNFYRLSNDKNTYILADFTLEKKEYKNYLKSYNFLFNTNISIPKIIEKNEEDLIIISEDFGDLRFDKILDKISLQELLQCAIDSLIVINETIDFNTDKELDVYNINSFKKEIIELPKYFFPYINLKSDFNLDEDFLYLWIHSYKKINFNFTKFIHKDFNMNNLIYLPLSQKHLKCGIIDFQSSFWGESSWDLFSLLEDSRNNFTDKYNEDLIEYFYNKTKDKDSFNEFKFKYHFLNCARQSRLLGRWIKLYKELNQKFYLKFIPVTLIRLKKSLKKLDNNHLNNFYNKYIFHNEF